MKTYKQIRTEGFFSKKEKKEVERMRISMLKKDTKKLVILWILHKV